VNQETIMKVLGGLAQTSLCLAVLCTGAMAATPGSQPAARHEEQRKGEDHGRHEGWENKPNHLKILKEPASQTVALGQPVVFSVEAIGKPDKLHYHWRKDGVTVGGNAPVFRIAATTAGNAGQYTVTVSNETGHVTSVPATLTLNQPPAILSQPSALTVAQGGTAVLQVAASGTGILGYQWSKAGAPIAGATSPALTLTAVTTAQAGPYAVVVTNTLNGTLTATASSPAVLTVNAPPAIQTQPAGLTVVQGGPASFALTATGSGTLSYQWTKGGAPLAGATASVLNLTAVTTADAGSYAAVVTNTLNGVATSTLSASAALVVNAPPAIQAQPAGLTVAEGGQASFTVTASGSGTLSYQWSKGRLPIAGATSSSLALAAVTAADATSYTVVVTNTLNGIATATASVPALLLVNVPPVFTVHPVSQTADLGSAATFTAAATPGQGAALSYQWRRDGQPIAGATDATYGLTAVLASDAASYDVVATGTLNGTVTTATSFAAVLTIHVPPTIQVQPKSQTVVPPGAVTFTVKATSNHGGTLTYAWKKNGTAVPQALSASYTVASTEFATNGDAYAVTVGDGVFSLESDTVYAQASVPSPVYAGDPVPVPSRPLTVLNSLHVNPVEFPNGAFRLGYDESLKNPVWTAYLNFPVHQPYANSDADYTADLRLAAPQVGKDDYTGIYTGGAGMADSYDRGHQVPRADVSYRYHTVAGDDATIMSNLVPQSSQFNQQVWQRLEETIGGSLGGDTDGLTSFKGAIYVYTGSVFPPSPAWWSSKVTPGLKIAMPTACYKIVVSEPTPGQPQVLAMLLPNVWGLTNVPGTLTQYVTSVARIEALTGLEFFPNLATQAPGLDIPTWKANVDVRGWRAPFEQVTGPNVHMVEPSWNVSVNLNDTVTFTGAATPAASAPGTTIAGTTWTFGDGSASTTGTSTSHVYTAGGSYNVTFTAQDSLGTSNTITRVIKVLGGNTPPTLPALANQATTAGTTLTATFTVADEQTAPGNLTVTATSDNTTLLPAALVVTNTNGVCTLPLAPAAGLTGTATITVTVTDSSAVNTSGTFVLTVNPGGVAGLASLIISQYYEGASYNKWIEVTNVGGGTYDASATPLYLGLWANPTTSYVMKTALIPGTLAPGASILFKNTAAVLPVAANLTNGASAIGNNTVINFNGNDPVFITTVNGTNVAAWDARTDTLGDLSWNAANPAADCSFYRNPAVLKGNPTWTASEWIRKTMAEVETAGPADTWQLGIHVYNH
jgi:DNA/RNA endonuclease G (NUC1)